MDEYTKKIIKKAYIAYQLCGHKSEYVNRISKTKFNACFYVDSDYSVLSFAIPWHVYDKNNDIYIHKRFVERFSIFISDPINIRGKIYMPMQEHYIAPGLSDPNIYVCNHQYIEFSKLPTKRSFNNIDELKEILHELQDLEVSIHYENPKTKSMETRTNVLHFNIRLFEKLLRQPVTEKMQSFVYTENLRQRTKQETIKRLSTII